MTHARYTMTLVSIFITVGSSLHGGIVFSKPTETKKYSLAPFSGIRIASTFIATIIQGAQSVTVTADKRVIDNVIITQNDNTIAIDLKQDQSASTYAKPEITISVPLLEILTCRDSTNVTAHTIIQTHLTVNATGTAKILLNNIHISKILTVNTSDTAEITAYGEVATQNCLLLGSSTYNALKLLAEKTTLAKSDTSKAHILSQLTRKVNISPRTSKKKQRARPATAVRNHFPSGSTQNVLHGDV